MNILALSGVFFNTFSQLLFKMNLLFRLKKMESQLDNVEEGLKEKKGKVLKEIEKVILYLFIYFTVHSLKNV